MPGHVLVQWNCRASALYKGSIWTGAVHGGGGGRGVGVDDWNGIVNQLNVVLLPWELAQFVKTVLVLG